MTDYTPDPEVVRVAAKAIVSARTEMFGALSRDMATAALRALHEAGWVVVPRVSTEEMDLAGHNARNDPDTGLPTHCGIDQIWTAMVNAVAQPPREGDGK